MLLVYVDDIIIIGSGAKHFSDLTHNLNKKFSLTYLDELQYFFRIKVQITLVAM